MTHCRTDLKAATEAALGVTLCPELFAYAEGYARHKLATANAAAGRAWGEGGYGDEYLELLIPDVIREIAFSAYCEQQSAEIVDARKAVGL